MLFACSAFFAELSGKSDLFVENGGVTGAGLPNRTGEGNTLGAKVTKRKLGTITYIEALCCALMLTTFAS